MVADDLFQVLTRFHPRTDTLSPRGGTPGPRADCGCAVGCANQSSPRGGAGDFDAIYKKLDRRGPSIREAASPQRPSPGARRGRKP